MDVALDPAGPAQTQMDADDVIARYLADASTAWSLGTFGALAEFIRTPDEPAEVSACRAATDRGVLRVEPRPAARLLAYETVTRRRSTWAQGVLVCLPAADAAMAARDVLTEVGRDGAADRPQDRDAVLFDLGLGIPHIDACVRTADADLIAALRTGCGRSIFAADSPALGPLLAASPTRVFASRLGRIEVHQAIPSPNAGAATPEGPHTHVLPKLLARKRVAGAGIPVPRGMLPCLAFYPANPATHPDGTARPFDADLHLAFQDLLARYGDRRYVAEKARAHAAVRAGTDPAAYDAPKSRLGRAGLRIALRQLGHTEPATPGLDAWRRRFDPARKAGRDTDDGHG